MGFPLVPSFLIVTEWTAATHALPRPLAAAALVVCLSMLPLGLRGYRHYLCLCAGLSGWIAGTALADLMFVPAWTVAAPVASVLTLVAWPRPVARWLLTGAVALAIACAVASLLTYGLSVSSFWVAFAAAAVIGVIAGIVARRFFTILLFAGVGAFGSLSALGAVVRARTGFFSPGGYASEPVVLAGVATTLVVASMAVQPMLAGTREL